MIVTDKFVFLHLPRSGGTFVYEVIRKFFPLAHEIGYHLPRGLLPESTRTFRSLVQFGTLGNSTPHGTTISILTSGIRHSKMYYSAVSARIGRSILSKRFKTH